MFSTQNNVAIHDVSNSLSNSMGVPFNEPGGNGATAPSRPADDGGGGGDDASTSSSSHPSQEESEHELHGEQTSSSESDPQGAFPYSGDESEEEWDDPSEGGTLTLVFRASETGDDSVLRQLLPSLSVSIDTPNHDGDTALHLAALYGHVHCAHAMLDHGARVDVSDEEGAIPLHDAAAGGYEDLVRLLAERAVESINRADSDGDTPLHNAARGAHSVIVSMLLQLGADPRIHNNDFLTPAALSAPDTEARRLLVEAETASQLQSVSLTIPIVSPPPPPPPPGTEG